MTTTDRTRSAILAAAVVELGHDPRGTISAIARRGGVGRTTVHRYFPDRAALIDAVGTLAEERFGRAAAAARLADGTGWEALARLLLEYFSLGDLLRLVFVDGSVVDPEAWPEDPGASGFGAVIRRGHADGTIDPELAPDWCELTMWVLLYSAWHAHDLGAVGRADAEQLLLRTAHGALGPKAF